MSAEPSTVALAALIAEALAPTVREAVEAAARAVLEEATPRTPTRLLTCNEVAARLSVHPETVRRAVRDGRLRAVTSLGPARFREEDVDRLLEGGAKS